MSSLFGRATGARSTDRRDRLSRTRLGPDTLRGAALIGLATVTAGLLTLAGCGGKETPPCASCVDAGDAGDSSTDAHVDLDAGDAGLDAESEVDTGVDAGLHCANLPGLYIPGSCSVLSTGVERFTPRYPLWSDGAEKDRFVYLPPGTSIDASNPDAWRFPIGTTFWKHFSREPTAGGTPIRVETRMIQKVSSNGVGSDNWEMRTFAWNATGDEVTETMAVQNNVLGTAHDIPAAPSDCQNCHRTADAVLGFSAIQLNNPSAVGQVTLQYLLSSGRLGSNPPAALTVQSAVVPGTAAEAAALGYMVGNCAHCHNGGVGGAIAVNSFDTFVPIGLMAASDAPVYTTGVGVAASWNAGTYNRIEAQSAATSAVVLRMLSRTNGNQMPPLATEDVDTVGVASVSAWINALP